MQEGGEEAQSAAEMLAKGGSETPLMGPWRPGAPVGKAGRSRGAHLQLTLPPGRRQVCDAPAEHHSDATVHRLPLRAYRCVPLTAASNFFLDSAAGGGWRF